MEKLPSHLWKQQAEIRMQDPGLATWDDVALFLQELAGAKRTSGYKRLRFTRDGDHVRPVEDDAVVSTEPARVSHGVGDILDPYEDWDPAGGLGDPMHKGIAKRVREEGQYMSTESLDRYRLSVGSYS